MKTLVNFLSFVPVGYSPFGPFFLKLQVNVINKNNVAVVNISDGYNFRTDQIYKCKYVTL